MKLSCLNRFPLNPTGCVLAIIASILAFTDVAKAQTNALARRFENNVRLYEAADQASPPPTNAILLAGDSQFYRWKTVNEDLAGYTVINRGIDSFETSDLLYFANRLVLPYHARLIILHIGGNDVHGGKTPDQVLADFKALVAKIRAVQPTVPIAFSSLTPGPARLAEFDRRQETNRVLKNYIATQPNLLFIDLWDAMLTPDGKPRPDLWVADGVHPSHAGYLLRVQIMQHILGAPDKKFP
jgi:lysophospholipase L1-like esterase